MSRAQSTGLTVLSRARSFAPFRLDNSSLLGESARKHRRYDQSSSASSSSSSDSTTRFFLAEDHNGKAISTRPCPDGEKSKKRKVGRTAPLRYWGRSRGSGLLPARPPLRRSLTLRNLSFGLADFDVEILVILTGLLVVLEDLPQRRRKVGKAGIRFSRLTSLKEERRARQRIDSVNEGRELTASNSFSSASGLEASLFVRA
jgi:hypothetical protein